MIARQKFRILLVAFWVLFSATAVAQISEAAAAIKMADQLTGKSSQELLLILVIMETLLVGAGAGIFWKLFMRVLDQQSKQIEIQSTALSQMQEMNANIQELMNR